MNIKTQSYKAFGHDIISLQMHLKMIFMVSCLIFALHFFLTTLSFRVFLGGEGVGQFYTWCLSKIISPILPGIKLTIIKNAKTISANASEFASSDILQSMIISYKLKIILSLVLPLPVWLLFPKIFKTYKIKEQIRIQPKYLEGAKLLTPEQYKNLIEKKYTDTYIPFGGWYDGNNFIPIKLPVKVENVHITLFGGTQSGKTVLLSQIIDALRNRGDSAVILDQKGDYIEKFYTKQDYILNVLDNRCMVWNFWDDLENENTLLRLAEIEAVAGGLIPDAKDSTEQFFRAGARDVLIGILVWLDAREKHSYSELWNTINQPRDKIAKILEAINHRGHVYVSEPGKQSQGIISVLIQFGRVFEYASALDQEASTNKYIMSEWLDHGQGFVYLTNYDSIRDTLRPMLSMFLNFLAKKILTSPERRTGRRIWLLLDEFGSLQKIGTLVDILTRGASKGVCVVLGTQDRGQIEEIYGPNMTDAIFNSCNSWAALRCADPATARLAVDRIGEWRFERQEESISDRFDDGGDSISIAKRTIREKLLLDSDVMGQEPLQAYIHVDGCDYSHVRIEKRFFASRNPAFIPRKSLLPATRLPVEPENNYTDITSEDIDMEVGI